jgi:hypothetical protein
MGRTHEPNTKQAASGATALGDAARQRVQRDLALPMSERLARVHYLCKQMTGIAGAARRK